MQISRRKREKPRRINVLPRRFVLPYYFPIIRLKFKSAVRPVPKGPSAISIHLELLGTYEKTDNGDLSPVENSPGAGRVGSNRPKDAVNWRERTGLEFKSLISPLIQPWILISTCPCGINFLLKRGTGKWTRTKQRENIP